MLVPPKLVRRVVIAPLVVLTELAILVASPLLALVAAVASLLTGGTWRPLRVVAIGVSWTALHLAATLACPGLWVAGGLRRDPARTQRAYHEVLRWFVSGVNRSITRLAGVRVRITGSAEAEEALGSHRRPAIVLSRHAGEGDSMLVLHALLCRYRRQPRVVLHEGLQLDPLLDVLGHRLHYRFVDPRGGDIESEITAMSRGLGGGDAVLIFPEGGNFSNERRARGIERLEEGGHDDEAARAREMEHVAAPRPGGALAAVDGAPEADVIFVGHAGIPAGVRNLWRLLLAERTVELRMWVVRAEEIPPGRDERIDWLFGWWLTLDRWVDERVGEA
jgi:1-acyl-sn-glycerol-3-phosphate acyltransferase